MQKLQDSVFSIVKTTNLSPAVFSYLQPSDDFPDKTPLGGILNDTKHGWLALGPKFCVVDLRTGLKVAARTFGASLRTTVTSVVELPTPLTNNSQQLLISLECEDIAGMICVFHINGSQILRCIQTEIVVTQLAVCDRIPDGPFSCYDGIVMAGTKTGEVFVFDLNRASLIQALKHISQGYEHLVRNEENLASITFLPLSAVEQMEVQRDLVLENDDHIAILLNENSLVEGQYIFRNPDGSVRMKAKRNHIRVTVIQYIPQLGSLAVGFNFGAFQIWNLLNLDLEFTSQVNVECLPVTHFGFQEPCDDPRAFCYLWVVFSVIDRFDEEEFPLAVMYSLTYQGKRMLSDTQCLYQEFLTATIRFQVELSTTEENAHLVGGRCVSCHTYSVNSMLGGVGEDSMLNICQLVWECWEENANSSTQYGMLLFDLDQWYKDQMPATYQLQSNAFMSATSCRELARGAVATLDVRLSPSSVSVYCAATRLEEHFYPNSLHYDCICLNTSEACVLSTIGIQRQIINSLDEVGPTALLNPTRLYNACVATGLVPLYMDTSRAPTQEEQRRYLLSVALEARLSRFLKRCAHDWATGSHSGAGCTLTFLVDWCWKRALELKENARELTAPLFTSSALPDRNVVRCLEHCVQQLTQLTGLLDAVLTKCCNLVIPDALSEMEEKYKGIGTVSLYFQVVQWFLRCGLLPERNDSCNALPYPGANLVNTYSKRRLKLHRLQDHVMGDDNAAKKSCSLLYIDQLIEQEFGGERIHQMWIRGGSECHGLYPPPSLYSLLRLYLLPDIAEEHKHSLVLYLLVDYSMVYDEVRYEAVIRRLMQFPTMFGLSNTSIKATQAFWHLDHRDFDFALDQLQCLTGNTLSEWQHNVVLSSLLAQKKTQAALQYLHVRKPAPIQNVLNELNNSNHRVNDLDKLEDWQSCCSLYLARGLVFEALDVIRMCVQNAGSMEDKTFVLNFFFKACRNTGQLSKILQVTLLPFEEAVFISYLENCNESQTSDILIMYYLQQARYLEAEQYNKKLKHSKPARVVELTASLESLTDVMDREGARDALVEVVCASLPTITNTVAHCALEKDLEPHIVAPKPMSVFVQAKSPKNTFTYKSSFIQDTIENASETWVNKPRMRKGLKRMLNVEETPFICTPKLSRSRNVFTDVQSESTPPKRARLDLSGTPKTPRSTFKVSDRLSRQMETLLDMPEVQSPDVKIYERMGAETPHSILKIRHNDIEREQPSPVDSRYMDESDDELLETASNNTHYSDSTNKHLRFTIPTASESGSTPSPLPTQRVLTFSLSEGEKDPSTSQLGEKETDISIDSYTTTQSHAMNDPNPLESPPKRIATEEKVQSRKTFKDSVRGRRSLSISANSSLSEDPNTSIESIADIPITLVNPRYSGERRRSYDSTPREEEKEGVSTEESEKRMENKDVQIEVPKTPKGRRGIRAISGESTPKMNRSRSGTPDRQDSPIITTPLRQTRSTRSRSKTPEISPRSSPLEPIIELPKQEVESEAPRIEHTLPVPRQRRTKSRTPERIETVVECPQLEAITESPTKSSESPTSSPTRRSLRSRSKTPEKLMSPKKDPPRSAKKSLTRLVLESNAVKSQKKLELITEVVVETLLPESTIECTPMKSSKPANLLDVTISPIASKSILHSTNESVFSESKSDNNDFGLKSLPAFTMNETKFGKSILNSYESSIAETSHTGDQTKEDSLVKDLKSLPAFTIGESIFGQSILHSYQSSVGDTSVLETEDKDQADKTDKNVKANTPATTSIITGADKSVLDNSVDESKAILSSLLTSDSDIEMKEDNEAAMKEDNEAVIQKEKEKIVEIEREIHEIEKDISDEEHNVSSDSGGDEQMEPSEESEAEADDEDAEEEEEEEEDEEIEEDSDEEEDEEESVSENDQEEKIGENEEVISIGSSSNSDRLQIDDESNNSNESDKVSGKSATREIVPAPTIEENKIIESRADEVVDKSKIFKESDSNLAVRTQNVNEVLNASDPTGSVQVNEGKEISAIGESNVLQTTKPISTIQVSENEADSTKVEETTDPLNLGQVSLMTDDNSLHSDKSTLLCSENLDKSDEKVEAHRKKYIPSESDVELEIKQTEDEHVKSTSEKGNVEENVPRLDPDIETDKPKKVSSTLQSKSKSVEDTTDEKPSTIAVTLKGSTLQVVHNATEKSFEVDARPTTLSTHEDMVIEDQYADTPKIDESATQKESETNVIDKNISEKQTENDGVQEIKLEDKNKKASRRVLKTPDREIKKPTEELEKPTPRTRKRTKSTSSNKSTKETDSVVTKTEETKTPRLRKRSQSIASTESEDKTPEKPNTPSRRRAKTPTSSEPRKILTRRASKEISEKASEFEGSIIDETATPRRRTTRAQSKQDDDVSIASSSSVISIRSSRSKVSEDGGDVKPVRKGRKSALKPDLSVIPELAVEEATSKVDEKEDIIKEYSSSRRLTRHQKSVLESWLEPKPAAPPRRRASNTSRSVISDQSHVDDDDDDASTHSSGYEVQPIDRISLMNKTDFQGSPDSAEIQSNVSPESIASDAVKQRRLRINRAKSESKSTPKAARITRGMSVDIMSTSEVGSPSTIGSPARGRRASFNRACEALHTPKGRRTSTDVKKGESDSPQGSPVDSESSATPSRRATRRTSVQSATSSKVDTSKVDTSKVDASKVDTGTSKRSKKSSSVDESKETKKK